MQHAQFRAIPPFEKVEQLFVLLTATPLTVGSTWNSWVFQSNSAPFEEFRPYIRPSHQSLLNAQIAGTARNPAAFLRQLLRPHNYTIKTLVGMGGWQLQSSVDTLVAGPVRHIKKPIRIGWE